MIPAALSARSVHKRYPGGVRALVDVDLDVDAGETLALIGESGCGKSTLLRLFNKLERATSGEIRIGPDRVDDLDPIALRRSTGYVQQDAGLLPHWTVRRNVELVPRLLGWVDNRREKRVAEVLQLAGLDPEPYLDRLPHELSGGQRQRVAFARAIAADPDRILLDEPFGALDALTRRELQDQFVDLKSRLGKTTILVTHDLDEALRLGDRVAVMREGRLLQCDRPERLLTSPAEPYVERLLSRRAGQS